MALVEHNDQVIAVSGGRFEDYLELLKPSVMSLVVFTAFVAMLLAPGGINPVEGFIAIVAIALGGGASGALNMWYDADIDAVMSRTANRPIPAGRVSRQDALLLGLSLSVFSVVLLGLAANWVSAGLLAFTIFFYAVIYTIWLKRSTPQNIVIGGAAGALPAIVGWAAVTGSVSIESLVMFLIVFLWTPPHFWALALYKQSDYGVAGVPMMPNVAGETSTKWQILGYTLVLALSTLLPSILGFAGWLYTCVALLTGTSFVVLAARLVPLEGAPMRKAARALFAYSLSYLFIVFLGLLVDAVMMRNGWSLLS